MAETLVHCLILTGPQRTLTQNRPSAGTAICLKHFCLIFVVLEIGPRQALSIRTTCLALKYFWLNPSKALSSSLKTTFLAGALNHHVPSLGSSLWPVV